MEKREKEGRNNIFRNRQVERDTRHKPDLELILEEKTTTIE